jgi:hypothetical protein
MKRNLQRQPKARLRLEPQTVRTLSEATLTEVVGGGYSIVLDGYGNCPSPSGGCNTQLW